VGSGDSGEGGGSSGGLMRVGIEPLAAGSFLPLPAPLVKDVVGMTTFAGQDARGWARLALASIVVRAKAVIVLVGDWSSRDGVGDGGAFRGRGASTAICVLGMIDIGVYFVVRDGKSARSGRLGEREGFLCVGWVVGGGEFMRLRLGLDTNDGRAGGCTKMRRCCCT